MRLERAALAVAVDLVDPRPEDVLLDVGTGNGGLLRTLGRSPAGSGATPVPVTAR